MMLLLGAVIAALLSYLTFVNLSGIKEYIRWRIIVEKLPKIVGHKFFIGHAAELLGYSNEEFFLKLREWLVETRPACQTLSVGPLLVLVVLVGPDEIEAVISSTKNLEKGQIYDFFHQWLEDGLLTTTGRKWQERRKLLTPAFHFTILRQFLDIFTRETSNLVNDIEEKFLNKPTNIYHLISNFTLLIINETSMGTKLDTNSKEGMTYKQAIYSMGDILFNRFMSPWLHNKRIFDISATGRQEKKLIKIMHGFTGNIIQKRAKSFKVFEEPLNEDGEFKFMKRKYPLLDILLNVKFKDNSIDDVGIREEVNTFMFEGHDTTAMSLMYTCMLLACHQDIQEEVYKETSEIMGTSSRNEPIYADIQDMTLLERCIKESLRLYPPVAVFGRKLDCDVSTKYGIIPKGSACYFHIYDLHRNEKYWPDPHKFDPSRHLTENSRDRHPFAYIPFSAGPRNCIGQRFAMLEMKAAICGLVRKFILLPVDTPETLVLTQDLILRPKNGVKIKFVLRN